MMREKETVVITGMGAVSPIGNTVDEMWDSVLAGRCGIAPITRYDVSDRKVKLAGEVRDLDLSAYMDGRDARRMDRYAQYAVAAAVQAMRDAGIPEADESMPYEERIRWGCMMASGIGGLRTIEEEQMRGVEKGFDRVSPYFIPKTIANMGAAHIAIRYGLHGICTCAVTACASAANAIGDAYRMIADGYADLILAGGAESALTPLGMGGFTSLKALTDAQDPARASIPFDQERSGFVMGEGAGAIVLESLTHARARGAKIYAVLAGYGTTCDAYHMTAPMPDGTGAAACMKLALQDAGVQPEEVDYINAHGTSTPMNDKCETAAIYQVFGERARGTESAAAAVNSGGTDHLRVSSTKSMTGHLLGASAAIEAILTAKTLQEKFLPPTVNYRNPDPECALDVVPNLGYTYPVRTALSNSFGFGGHNVCLVFKKAESLQ